MEGVLNETTNMVHRREKNCDCRSACGATLHVSRDRLRTTSVERAIDDANARRCGRCFSDAGGY